MGDPEPSPGGEKVPDWHAGGLESGLPSLERNPVRRWVLVSGNRWLVSAIVLFVVGFGLVVLGSIWTDELLTMLTETQVVRTVFITLLSGIILLVSIAVSINSIVLSQEITALGDQRERVEDTFAFRDAVQEHTRPEVSPARPAVFLRTIFEAIRSNAEELAEDVPADSTPLHDQVVALRDDVVAQLDVVEDDLRAGQFGTSEVLTAGIRYDYSHQVRAASHIRREHENVLTDEQDRRLDELLTVLKYFTIGREYFKTLYFKREMANLSRGLLALAFPAVVFLSYAIVTLEAGLIPDLSAFGVPAIVLFVGVTYVVGLAPYTLFSAYVFRTATISLETLSAGPFIIDDGDGRDLIDLATDEESR